MATCISWYGFEQQKLFESTKCYTLSWAVLHKHCKTLGTSHTVAAMTLQLFDMSYLSEQDKFACFVNMQQSLTTQMFKYCNTTQC